MAAWPDLDELKQVLDVTSDVWDGEDDDSRLTGLLSAAIDVTQQDTYETEEPSANLSRAALRMAEMMATKPELGADGWRTDPTYERFIYGNRREFGIG